MSGTEVATVARPWVCGLKRRLPTLWRAWLRLYDFALTWLGSWTWMMPDLTSPPPTRLRARAAAPNGVPWRADSDSPLKSLSPETVDDAPPNAGFAVLFAFGAVCLLLFQLGPHRTFGRHEVFAAVPAREMLRTGDLIVPRFGGLPRLEKPPLAYWLVAASAKVFGRLDERTARVPAALAALALTAVIGLWARRWYGRTAGLGSAMATATSVFVLTYGRRAEVDMTLCLLTTSALFLIADQPADERPSRSYLRWIAIEALVAVAWMAKFHYGLVMTLVPAAIYFIMHGRLRACLQMFNPVGGLMLGAAAVLWPWLLLTRVPNAAEIWRQETIGRAVGELGHEPNWFYIPHVFSLAVPWTPLALFAAFASWRGAWRGAWRAFRRFTKYEASPTQAWAEWRASAVTDNSRERFLWTVFAVQFVIVSASANKHQHYLAAAMPFVWLLAGQGFASIVGRVRNGTFRVGWRTATLVSAAFIAGGVIASLIIRSRWPEANVSLIGVPLCIGLSGTVAAWMFHRRAWIPGCYALFAAGIAGYVMIVGEIVPAEDRTRADVAAFAKSVRGEFGPDQPILMYRTGMHSAVYYADDPVQRVDSLEDLSKELAEKRGLTVVTADYWLNELSQAAAVRVLRRPDFKSKRRTSRMDRLVLLELSCLNDVAREPPTPQSAGHDFVPPR